MQVTGYLKGKNAPGVTTFGRWSPFTWDNKGVTQHGLHLTPSQAPWREILQALDSVSDLPNQEIDVWEEAAAMVAACWRYGSYAYVLAEGQRYAPFQTDPHLSRIGDGEMKRIQLEFTSGLAEWLRVKALNPDIHRQRVIAARRLLPGVPVSKIGPYILDDDAESYLRRLTNALDVLDANERIAATTPTTEEAFRVEANYLVNRFYRNGRNVTVASDRDMPLEDLHAGTWSEGSEVPGYKRLYAGEVEAIIRPMLRWLTIHLAAKKKFDLKEFLPVFAKRSPPDWSREQETDRVSFYGMPGLGSLEPRLAELAKKNTVIYGKGL